MSKASVLCLLVLCIIIGLISIHSLDSRCPKSNQVWYECGTACPRRCNQKAVQLCTMNCVHECQCKEGYVLRNDNECVLPDDC